jgi:Fe-S cluster assembly ATP-binding protein
MAILQLENVTLRLDGETILDELSVSFEKGLVHAMICPNGAGKPTMAGAIMGLSEYANHDGDVILEGHSLKNASIDDWARRGIALAWQRDRLVSRH